jgi:hypothetical protein
MIEGAKVPGQPNKRGTCDQSARSISNTGLLDPDRLARLDLSAISAAG